MSRFRIHHQMANSKGNYHFDINTYFNLNWAPHFHKNFELIYVIDGKLSLSVGGHKEEMRAGDYALLLPDQIHAFTTQGKSSIWIAVFSRQFVPSFASEIENKEGIRAVFRPEDTVHRFLLSHLLLVESTVTMKTACFCAICDEYRRHIPLMERKSRNDDLICRVLDYVEAHCQENLSLSSVAEHFGYEYHYFSRILNHHYHINFPTLVNECRIERAIYALQNGNESITDIAMESGFQSIRNFNHVFLRITGCSPKDYLSKT